jgi:hypothetical protein
MSHTTAIMIAIDYMEDEDEPKLLTLLENFDKIQGGWFRKVKQGGWFVEDLYYTSVNYLVNINLLHLISEIKQIDGSIKWQLFTKDEDDEYWNQVSTLTELITT